ncbi:transmembrane protein, putative (macronuclear) [Tetrahymena thermophila SB210]|uniref:Transmembrane protein, putative n=1 Tax=Tetrahymena thermophila (strain SB210) TaxID=312017 RepID=Q23B07_TETTS|nr:transmembrane protein, putative [Tetrahymena thermophila SB210]EAR93677.1 transmembrane protein, putative [Tetrahymena thermophila SB210]|eukprot:XP_001013922.1 transmembrane protein, putative [Tetrahymena thermophila SB210]
MIKKILLITIIACFIPLTFSSQSQYAIPSNKPYRIILDDKFNASLFVGSLGEVDVSFNMFSRYIYLTSPQCSNCIIYSQNDQKAFTCNKNENCAMTLENVSEDVSGFKATGDYINLPIILNGTPFTFNDVFYVKQISELKKSQNYVYQGIGLQLDEESTSSFIHELKEQGIIEDVSYSLYYEYIEGYKGNYLLTIGSYDVRLLSRQFYNLMTLPTLPTQKKEYDRIKATASFSGQEIQIFGSYVILDPTVENFVLSYSYFNEMKNIMEKYTMLPDLSPFTQKNPGLWQKFDKYLNFQISFSLDDPDQISTTLDVEFSAKEFTIKNERGQYTLDVTFVDADDSFIRVGKKIFKKMMYYKRVSQTDKKVFRSLAPLKESKQLLRQEKY